jgi:hypothetical protein
MQQSSRRVLTAFTFFVAAAISASTPANADVITFEQTSPNQITYVLGTNFSVFDFSGIGNVTAILKPVADVGCASGDYAARLGFSGAY